MLTADPMVLVCSVGGSPAPVIYGLSEHKPDYVLFICSASSASAVEEQILPSLDFLPQTRVLNLANEQDLLACVVDIRTGTRQALDAWGLPADCALLADFTGGTKVMSAALVMALMEYKVQFTYIGGAQRTKGGLGIVQGGHERLMRLANPWQALASAHIRQIVDAFNACQFQQAEKEARLVASRHVRPVFFAALADLFHAYALWDGFLHEDAAELFPQALARLQRHASPALSPLCEKFKANSLALKTAADEYAAFMERRSPCPNYLCDLVANALRREKYGYYDDAVARLYSVLEKNARMTLWCEYGFNTSALDLKKLPPAFLKEYTPPVSHDGFFQIPLFRAYQLLLCLKHPLGLKFMEQQDMLKDLLNARNLSLLAHGFQPVTRETCVKMKKCVLKFLDISESALTLFPVLTVNTLTLFS